MSRRNFSASSKTDQITNHPTNQGRHRTKHCLCGGCRASLSASALARVEGYTKSTYPKGRAGQSIGTPAKGIFLRSRVSTKQRIQYPPPQFIPRAINYLERGVTKP
jgi:hypothetical protein